MHLTCALVHSHDSACHQEQLTFLVLFTILLDQLKAKLEHAFIFLMFRNFN